ncbi:MAG TPA: type II toxin-antitoxin system VapB family antitoxin [Longimicrobiales bacterium]|nr:type II toxin-antitoxin system VapB family antitoxin [Longimicrobiales bacterium]
MRTTVDLDRKLLERAKRALGTPTYREAITRALEEAIARADMRALLDRLAGSDATWDLDELFAYRRLGDGDPA